MSLGMYKRSRINRQGMFKKLMKSSVDAPFSGLSLNK